MARLADTVIRVYLGSGATGANHYRLAVLGEALARRLTATAQRLAQTASELPPADYHRVITDETAHFADLWRRWCDAGGPPADQQPMSDGAVALDGAA